MDGSAELAGPGGGDLLLKSVPGAWNCAWLFLLCYSIFER